MAAAAPRKTTDVNTDERANSEVGPTSAQPDPKATGDAAPRASDEHPERSVGVREAAEPQPHGTGYSEDTQSGDAGVDLQKQTRRAAEERLREREGLPTADAADVNRAWTVQQGGIPAEPTSAPGAVFTPEELPDPDVQRANNIDPASANAGLVVVHDEDERVAVRSGAKPVEDVERDDAVRTDGRPRDERDGGGVRNDARRNDGDRKNR
jgi:hypothetical protein